MKILSFPTKPFQALCLLISLLLPAVSPRASTFNYTGRTSSATITNDGNEVGRLTNTLEFIGYTSNTGTGVFGRIDNTGVHNGKTTAGINGRLVSNETFMRAAVAVGPGREITVYENQHFDLQITPPFFSGQLQDVTDGGETLRLWEYFTNRNFHHAENFEKLREVRLDPDAVFFEDGETEISRAEALGRAGRWAQVHPPRRQILWVETGASDYDWSLLRPPEIGQRGYANSFSGMARFLGYTRPATTTLLEYRVLRQGNLVTDTRSIPEERIGLTLDGRIVPNTFALKPGRTFIANHYRSEQAPHQMYFRSRDDELRGEILSMEALSFEIEAIDWDDDVSLVTVDRSLDAIVYLDGAPSTYEEALQPGRRVRVFPERPVQRVHLFNEYVPNGTATAWRPRAAFVPSRIHFSGTAEVTLDGNPSYDLNGSPIVSWQWQLGDGSTASGPVVTHTYNPGAQFRNYRVTLTVTNAAGDSGSAVQYLWAQPGLLRANGGLPEDYLPGMLREAHQSGTLKEPATWSNPLPGNGEVVTDWPDGFGGDGTGLTRYSGYLHVPETGLYSLNPGQQGGSPSQLRLVLSGQVLNDVPPADDWGWFEGSKRELLLVELERGLHPFEFYANGRLNFARLTWAGPGIDESLHPNRRVAPSFLFLQRESDEPGFDPDKTNQTLSFSHVPDKLTTDAPFDLSASASSALPVTFSVVSGPASVHGATVTLGGEEGLLVLRAHQAGDADFNPASHHLVVRVTVPRFPVRLTVRHADTLRRVADASVLLDGRTLRTDQAGILEVALPAGNHPYTVSQPGFATSEGALLVADSAVTGTVDLFPASRPPVFLLQPIETAGILDLPFTLEALADGYPEPDYQWFFNEDPLPGASARVLTIPSARFADAGTYRVEASNDSSTLSSAAVVVTVSAPSAPGIVTPPAGGTALEADDFVFTAGVDGAPAPVLQWFKTVSGGEDLPLFDNDRVQGAATSQLTLLNLALEDAGSYYLTATNSEGRAQSSPVTLEVDPRPPVAFGLQRVVIPGLPLPLTLSGSDLHDRPLDYSILAPPARGALSGTPPALTYTPAAGFTGTDTFTFLVSVNGLESPPATVTLHVTDEPLVWAGGTGQGFWDRASPYWTGPLDTFVDGSQVHFNSAAQATQLVLEEALAPHALRFSGGKAFRFTEGSFASGSLRIEAGTSLEMMDYAAPNAPQFEDITLDGGTLLYRITSSQLPEDRVLTLGPGTLALDNHGVFSFRHRQGEGITLTNPIQIGPGGGTINSSRDGGNPRSVFTGRLTLGGDLSLTTSGGGNNEPTQTYAGPIVLSGGDRTLRGVGGFGNGKHVVLSGNIAEDDSPRRLSLGMAASRIVVSGPDNSWSGGTVILAGDGWVEVTAGSSLGTGDVLVENGGELRLAANDNIAPAAKLNLQGVVVVPAGVTLTVSELTLGATTHTSGTFHSGNAAPFVSGGGQIVVESIQLPAHPFDAWMDGYAADIPAERRAPGYDHSGDGLSNLMKFALGLDPRVVNTAGRPALILMEESGIDRVHFSFRRRAGGTGDPLTAHTAHGVIYRAMMSTALETGLWLSGPEHFELAEPPRDNGDGTETVTLRLLHPLATLDKVFLLLQVETPP